MPTGMSPATVTRLQPPRLLVVVVDRVVLGDPVVEQHELVRRPAPAAGCSPAGSRTPGAGRRMSRDSASDRPTMRWAKPPMNRPRSPVSGCTRTTGWAVSYLMRDEDLAAVLVALARGSPAASRSRSRWCARPQRVGEGAQRLGQVPVGGAGVRDQRLAAVGRDDDAAQRAELRRVEHEGDVGVPVVGAAVARCPRAARSARPPRPARSGARWSARRSTRANRCWPSSSRSTPRKTSALCSFSAARTAATVSGSRSERGPRPVTSAPMRAVTLRMSSLVPMDAVVMPQKY